MTRRLTLLLAFMATFTLAGCGETQDADRSAAVQGSAAQPTETSAAPGNSQAGPCVLTMGWDPWEPYQYKDVEDRVRGLDVELVQAILGAADCSVKFEEGRWGTLVRQLQTGEIDLLTGATRTTSRESFALFSAPYRNEDFKLYVRAGEGGKFDFSDFRSLIESGFRIGVTEQYIYGDVVTQLQENPKFADQFQGATIGELNYARLLDLAIDGFLEDPFVAARTFRARGLADDIDAHPIEVHSGEVSLMFSRASVTPDLVARIDAALAQIKADGRHQAIIDKYLE